MRLFTLYTLFLLTLLSCKKDEKETLVLNPCGISFDANVHYAAIGDEFSSGLYISNDEAWPVLIEQFIDEQGYSVGAFVQIGGIGYTSAELLIELNNTSEAECKNFVTLMAGASDQLNGTTTQQFQSDFSALLAKAITIAGSASKVICVTIPDYSIAPGLPSSAGSPSEAKAEIESFNSIIAMEAEMRGALVADIYPISESAYQVLYVPEDTLHADADQHSIWANIISAKVLQSLN